MFSKLSRGLKWIDAGQKDTHDFTVSDFTNDSSFHDLDLSAKVPANAKWIILGVKIKGSVISSFMEWASKSTSTGYPQYNMAMKVTAVIEAATIILPLDGDKKVQYRLQAGVTWSSCDVDIIGYAI